MFSFNPVICQEECADMVGDRLGDIWTQFIGLLAGLTLVSKDKARGKGQLPLEPYIKACIMYSQ